MARVGGLAVPDWPYITDSGMAVRLSRSAGLCPYSRHDRRGHRRAPCVTHIRTDRLGLVMSEIDGGSVMARRRRAVTLSWNDSYIGKMTCNPSKLGQTDLVFDL